MTAAPSSHNQSQGYCHQEKTHCRQHRRSWWFDRGDRHDLFGTHRFFPWQLRSRANPVVGAIDEMKAHRKLPIDGDSIDREYGHIFFDVGYRKRQQRPSAGILIIPI